ncbi:putative gustatory receptor 2a isoform X2 [Coccinella septempunctata]|uniref:putative gustatory receptor 2a isoform X2 n=1 Tax=Coccinella septempunctata TaxID=41139 RepID=UPI001D090492|nr:putative gustatory receptor 2a isoform X2 [Coccinella septempunctata]
MAGDERDLELHSLLNMTLLFLCTTVTWIEAAMKVEKWSRLLKEIVRIDQELAKHNIKLEYGYGMRRSLEILAGQLVGPSLVFMFLEKNVDYAEIFFIYCVPHCIICVTGYVYYEIVNLIEMRLTKLNYLLKTLAKPNSNEIFTMTTNKNEKSFDLLCQICMWHHTLVKLITLMNKTFGFRMVSLFIFSFDILAMHAFLISRYFKMEINVIHLSEYVTLFICYAINVYIICKHCEYTVQEVKKTGSLLHQINTSDKDMINEIAMFSFQILNEEVAFSGAGFFEINYCLLFSIIGGVTTYTIILIQLQMDGLQNGSITTQNFTEVLTIQNVSDLNL